MIDDFVMNQNCEEYYDYMNDYENANNWYEVEASFCYEEGYEPECYED